MSAKNRGEESDELDRYYTPEWVVALCVEHILKPFYSYEALGYDIENILEPSAGGGAFVDGLRAWQPDAWIGALDIDPDAGPWSSADESFEGDFLETDFISVDLVGGNPPYSHAQAHTEEALRISGNVFWLLRQGFLASGERVEFWKKNPPSRIYQLPNRPKFLRNKKSGDSADYVFICWRHGWTGPTEFEWLPDVPIKVRKGIITYQEWRATI